MFFYHFFKSLSSPVLFVSQEQLDTETSTTQSETIQTATSLLASQVLSAKSKGNFINVVKISFLYWIKVSTSEVYWNYLFESKCSPTNIFLVFRDRALVVMKPFFCTVRMLTHPLFILFNIADHLNTQCTICSLHLEVLSQRVNFKLELKILLHGLLEKCFIFKICFCFTFHLCFSVIYLV